MREHAFTVLSMLAAVVMSSVDPATVKQSEEFVREATIAGRYQIEAAELARSRGTEPTRLFASHSLDDHARTERELERLARSQGLALPKHVDARREAELVRLGEMVGPDFDREYAAQQVQAHTDAVDLYERESSGGKDTELRAFATERLSALQSQLQRAQDLGR
jgi:putative membrane protein